MQVATLLNQLGYDDSPNFLRRGEGKRSLRPVLDTFFAMLARNVGFTACMCCGHLPGLPLNQWFLLSTSVRLRAITRPTRSTDWCGTKMLSRSFSFRHSRVFDSTRVSVIVLRRKSQPRECSRVLKETNEVLELAESFHADAIDEAKIWHRWGKEIRPEDRVDWRLLET